MAFAVGRLMAVNVIDEGLHPADDDVDWQESAYFTWRDPESGLGGNHRIGNEVNRGTANLWCGVYHRDGRASGTTTRTSRCSGSTSTACAPGPSGCSTTATGCDSCSTVTAAGWTS